MKPLFVKDGSQMEFVNPNIIRRFTHSNQHTLPRFSVQVPAQPTVFRMNYNNSKRMQSIVLGGFALFLVGGMLLVVGTMGAGTPLFVVSGVFFGLGIAALLAGIRKSPVFPTEDQ